MRVVLCLWMFLAVGLVPAAWAAFYDDAHQVPIVSTYPLAVQVVRSSPYVGSLPPNAPPPVAQYLPVFVVHMPGQQPVRYQVYGLHNDDEAAAWGYYLMSDWIDYPQRGARVYYPSLPVAYVPVNADGYHSPDTRIAGYSADGRTLWQGR